MRAIVGSLRGGNSYGRGSPEDEARDLQYGNYAIVLHAKESKWPPATDLPKQLHSIQDMHYDSIIVYDGDL